MLKLPALTMHQPPSPPCSSLTRLASLRICCEDDWHPGWVVLPEFPPEIERLRGLTHLSLTSKVHHAGRRPRCAALCCALAPALPCAALPVYHNGALQPSPTAPAASILRPSLPLNLHCCCRLPHAALPSLQGIKEVPAFISRLAALRDLRLAGCGLSTLPPEVSALGCLTVLKLNNNPLGKGLSGDPE